MKNTENAITVNEIPLNVLLMIYKKNAVIVNEIPLNVLRINDLINYF